MYYMSLIWTNREILLNKAVNITKQLFHMHCHVQREDEVNKVLFIYTKSPVLFSVK